MFRVETKKSCETAPQNAFPCHPRENIEMAKPKIRFNGRAYRLPANRATRIAVGVLLIIGGCFGFLPVLGFWMIPLGVFILSLDFHGIRRWRRRAMVRLGGWAKRRYPKSWSKYFRVYNSEKSD